MGEGAGGASSVFKGAVSSMNEILALIQDYKEEVRDAQSIAKHPQI